MDIAYFGQIILLRSKITSPSGVFNFLILATFKIKDFEGHYLKLVVLQGFMDFVSGIYIISMTIILLMTNSSSPTEVINFPILVTFKIKDFIGH